ncbi:MAG: helix-turn-helix domain-containing protein [Oscillospiraceae bacterium]|nr:helix-turn-helix domain-containing protein [Oscillospiraceae bacterium]
MAKSKRKNARTRVELRYYDIPQNESVLALLGQSWKRNYGHDVECLHFHNLMEIGICRKGVGVMQFEDIPEVPYEGGVVTILPRNVPHNTYTDGEGRIDFWEYLFVDVAAIIKEFGPQDIHTRQVLTDCINRTSRVLHRTEAPTLSAIVETVMSEMRGDGKAFRRDQVGNLTMALMYEIARLSPEVEQGRALAGGGQIAEALEYIHTHYAESLRIPQLAEVCGLSETHFRRLFFSALNMTPVDYINLVRIQQACELLRATDDSMEAIAQKIGFTTQSSFNRSFLRLVGKSPMRWKSAEENCVTNQTRYHITAHEGWR